MQKKKAFKKDSPNAAAVAKEILETVRKGAKVNKGAIMRKHGYSEATSKHPKKVTSSSSYKAVVDPFVLELEKERTAAIREMKGKRRRAGYSSLVDGVHKFTHDIQLLRGRATGRLDLSFDPEEEAEVEELLKQNAGKL